jgi:hypothetical protein
VGGGDQSHYSYKRHKIKKKEAEDMQYIRYQLYRAVLCDKPTVTQQVMRSSSLLRNPKIHYRIQNSPSLDPIIRQQSQSTPSHPTTLKYILIYSSHPRIGLRTGLLPSGFPTKISYEFLNFTIPATFPTHHIPLDFITLAIFTDEWKIRRSRG